MVEKEKRDRGRLISGLAAKVMSSLLALTVVGLVLAMAGLFELWLLLPLSAVAAALTNRLWAGGPLVKAPARVWVAAGVVAVASIVSNAPFPSEQVIGGRDGGTYLATSAWLARDGGLFVTARTGAFKDAPDLEFKGLGFFDLRDDGRLSPQFLHGFPVLLATAYEVGGLDLAMRANALLGGLALMMVFGFAQLLVRPWLALLAQAALASNLVFVFYARAPFSEVLALLFFFAGLWALWTAWHGRSYPTMILAGLLIGGFFIIRIDGLVLLIPLLVMRAYEGRRPQSTPETRRLARGFSLGLMSLLALALVDLVVITPGYLAFQGTSVLVIFIGPVGVVAVDTFFGARLIDAADGLSQQGRRRVAGGLSILLILVLAFAYFVRLGVQEVVGDAYPVALQDADGSLLAEGRTFAEDSAVWLGWYLGPAALATAVVGWALLTRQVALGKRRFAVPFLMMFSTMALGYIARPSINPDHIWAMRRFLPVVIPGLLVVAAILIGALWDVRANRTGRAAGRVAALALSVGLLAGSVVATAPVASLHEFDGMAADLRGGCDLVGRDAAVLFIGSGDASAGSLLAASYRGFCGFPVAYTERTDAPYIDQLRSVWKEDGRRLWLASTNRLLLDGLSDRGSVEFFVGDYEQLELTVTRRPKDTTPVTIRLYAVEA